MRVRRTAAAEPWAVIRGRLMLIAVCCALIAACAVTRPTVKIGLVAPFEGRYRDVGYEVIYAVRLAVREANAAGGVAGYTVEVVSLDDSGDPEMAAEQARKLATDPQVVGVIGHWMGATTQAAAPEYDRTGIPLLATGYVTDLPASAFRLWLPGDVCLRSSSTACPESLEQLRLLDMTGPARGSTPPLSILTPAPLPADSADPGFADRYRAISNGVEPGFDAVLAYDAARLLFEAIARDVQTNMALTRAGVGAALAQSDFAGLSGAIRFDRDHAWMGRSWTYVWQDSTLVRP